uniref:hypothetical protein n=1 Tax=Nocardia farcinica TaxID=37329 RepID=UPI002453BD34
TSRAYSPTIAGVLTIPMVAGMLVASVVSGQMITRFGKWKSFVVSGAAVFRAATAGIPEEPIGGAEFHIAGRAARIVRRKLPRRARVRATLSNTYWL